MYRITPQQIRSWVIKHFPDYKSRKDGTELVINNPFNGDTGRHFNINIVKGTCNDWRGNDWAGYNKAGKRNSCSFIHFASLYLNCSYREAAKNVTNGLLVIDYTRDKFKEEVKDDPIVQIQLPPGCKPLDNATDKISVPVRNWLRGRGIDDCKIKIYNIHYNLLEAIWPYFEFEELVYWQTRSIINKQFMFPPDSNKGDYLYAFDHVDPLSYLVITEAIIDCQTLGGQCLASGGAVITTAQVKKIKFLNPVDGIILAPDNDIAGLKSILSNAKLLKNNGFDIQFSIPPKMDTGAKDWNDVGRIVGWDNVYKIMLDNVKSFDHSGIWYIHKLIEKDNRKELLM